MKKFFALVAVLLAIGFFAYAQDEEVIVEAEAEAVADEVQEAPSKKQNYSFEFSNTVSTDSIYFNRIVDKDDDNPYDEESGLDFAGISEEVHFKFDSEMVDAGVDLKFTLAPSKYLYYNTPLNKHLAIGWNKDDLDYWLEFRPIKYITLAYHDNVYLYGSYLPIHEDSTKAGANLGSNGFTIFGRPIDGLRIAVTIPFDIEEILDNFINGNKDAGEPSPFCFGAGVDYTYGTLFSVGVTALDLIDMDELTIGGYGLVRPTKARNFTIRAGFAHTQKATGMEVAKLDYREFASIVGKDIYSASLAYESDTLCLMTEAVGNIKSSQSMYDLYIGLKFGYTFNDMFTFDIKHRMFFDFDTHTDITIDILPMLTINYKKHSFTAGLDLEFCGANMYIAVPLSWTWTL